MREELSQGFPFQELLAAYLKGLKDAFKGDESDSAVGRLLSPVVAELYLQLVGMMGEEGVLTVSEDILEDLAACVGHMENLSHGPSLLSQLRSARINVRVFP